MPRIVLHQRTAVEAKRIDIHFLKQVVFAAVVAVHINLPLFGQHGICFFFWQRYQRLSAALSGTGAAENHRLAFKQRYLFFVIQAVQHFFNRQTEQFVGGDGFRHRCQMIELAVVALVCRQHLQQHTGRRRAFLMRAGFDEQAGWQLF